MPIFEYLCRQCQHRFEAIVQGTRRAACPSCQSTDLEQQLSVFAIAGKSNRLPARPSSAPCGTCGDPRGPGVCSLE